jgi:hypothetical protein
MSFGDVGMNTSPPETRTPRIRDVAISDSHLTIVLDDGRSASVPLEYYPRLMHGTPDERQRWELIGRGHGIHWEDLDEDISAEGLIAGRRSGEGPSSLQRWLERRAAGLPPY